MGTPLVSIIIPTFDSATTILETLDSALGQSHEPTEIIVIDDGSSDGTHDLVAARFPGVRLLREPHRGRSHARNRGLQVARGDYVQFLDSDDLLDPQKIAKQVDALEANPGFAGAWGDVECFRTGSFEKRWLMPTRGRPSGDVLPYMIDDGLFLVISVLVRTDWCRRIGGFDPTLPSNEDWDFWLRMCAAGARFVHAPEGTVAFYRIRDGVTAPNPAHMASGVRTLERLRGQLDPARARRLRLTRAIGRWRFGYGKDLLTTGGSRITALAQMVKGMTEDQRSLATKVAWVVLGGFLGSRTASVIGATRSWIRR